MIMEDGSGAGISGMATSPSPSPPWPPVERLRPARRVRDGVEDVAFVPVAFPPGAPAAGGGSTTESARPQTSQ
jgi:hypothetical protein